MRLACLLAAVLTVAGCGTAKRAAHGLPPSAVRASPTVFRALDLALRHQVELSGVPGASAAVVFADGREWAGAAGNAVLEPREAMSPRTSLPFDSVTKMATAALTLRLAEQGRLRLDDPIRHWYAAWRGDPRATVRDLLGHTSGLGDPIGRVARLLIRHPRRLVGDAEYLAATPEPGPRTRDAVYSNAGFVIVGRIIERAAGEPLAVAMRRELFGRPGGAGLALQPAERPHPPLVHTYWHPSIADEAVGISDGSSLIPSRAWASLVPAAGGLAGDVPSLARWADELLSGRILSAASLRQMTTFHPGGSSGAAGYGLGLARDTLDGHTIWGHEGDGLGNVTEVWHLPRERVTIAVAWNDDTLSRDALILSTLLRVVLAHHPGHAA